MTRAAVVLGLCPGEAGTRQRPFGLNIMHWLSGLPP